MADVFSVVGRVNPETLAHDIVATRDIKAGEEIAISCRNH
jgi:hypothetical protein